MPNKEKKKTFKKKVLVVFILISLVPLFVVTTSNVFFIWKTRQESIVELENLALEKATQKINAFIDEKLDGLELEISTSEQFDFVNSINYLPPDILYDFLMYAYNTSKPTYLDFVDLKGNIIVKIRENMPPQFSKSYINLWRSLNSTSSSMLANQNFSTFSEVEADVSLDESFVSARNNEQYFGQIYYVEDEERWTIRLASQIKNKDDIIGVVTADIDLRQVNEIINGISLGKTGYLAVLEKSGDTIGSGNTSFAQIGESLLDIRRVRELVTDKYEKFNKFDTYISPIGQEVVFAAKKNDKLDWYIIAEWPVDDAFSVVRNILYLSVLISIITLVVIIFLGAMLARQIIRPINILAKGAKEISGGNLDYEIDMDTGDEFELLSGQFNKMVKVLKENQQLRDEFVFIAAHELRTPVTAIKGYMSMLLDGSFGEVTPEIKENLDIVNSSNERLVQLVNDLLQVARSDAGKMQVDMTDIIMHEQVETVIKELKSLSVKKGIDVVYKQDSTVKVKADPFKLKEVLINLIGNSIKYTKGNGDIVVWHEKREKYLITHIKDHGIGMEKGEVEQLFGKFFRAQNDDTKEIQGTGLGLFIVKEIIERMGGEIWVESERGKGSTFSFRLKIA